MTSPKYNLSLAEALLELDDQLAKMRAETDRETLVDISSDDAFEVGYELAIRDLRLYTGPEPEGLEVSLRIVEIPTEEEK